MKMGFYAHYKGGLYFAITTSKFSEDISKEMVLYYSLHYWTMYTRPAEMWFDVVGETTRFKKVGLWYALTHLKRKK